MFHTMVDHKMPSSLFKKEMKRWILPPMSCPRKHIYIYVKCFNYRAISSPDSFPILNGLSLQTIDET